MVVENHGNGVGDGDGNEEVAIVVNHGSDSGEEAVSGCSTLFMPLSSIQWHGKRR